MTSKVLLIHGAWQGKWTREAVAGQLTNEQVNVTTMDLPGSGEDQTLLTEIPLAAYARAIVSKAQAPEGGITLVGHSMGGAAITTAASLRPDLFGKLIYVCTFLPRDGESVAQLSAESKTPSTTGPIAKPNEQGSLELVRSQLKATFFNHYTGEVDHLLDLFRPQPIQPLADKLNLTEGFKQLTKAYLICDRDLAVSPKLQALMAQRASISEIDHLDSGHEPFFTCTDSLITSLKQAINN